MLMSPSGGRLSPGPTHLLSHLSHRLDAGSVQVAVVLARLDEVVLLDVLLHLLSGGHKVIVPAVHLVVPLGPGGVCRSIGTSSLSPNNVAL